MLPGPGGRSDEIMQVVSKLQRLKERTAEQPADAPRPAEVETPFPERFGTAHRGAPGGTRPGHPDGRCRRAGLDGQAAGTVLLRRRLSCSP